MQTKSASDSGETAEAPAKHQRQGQRLPLFYHKKRGFTMTEELNRELTELLRQTDATKTPQFWITNDPTGRKSINAPVLAEHIIGEMGLYRTSEGIFDFFGNRYTDLELEKTLREKVQLYLPEISGNVIKNNALPALLDRIPAKSIEIKNAGVSSYIKNRMQEEINTFSRAGNINTGFDKFDEQSGGLFPGLYVIGAISSLGKTTFIHQIADQIAAAGKHVLFFSLEMSRLEMTSKSISRKMAQLDYSNAMTSLKIRRGTTSNLMQRAMDEYAKSVGDRLNIIEGGFDTTVSFIGEYVRQYIEKNNARPVVIVDYLQIIQGAQKATIREATDFNVVELKRISRALDVPVIVISSVNRGNYLLPVDYESFKESGGIEYTADVVLGLQLACLDEDIFSRENKIKEKRDRIKSAKGENPREVKLVCLKNRYGRTDWMIDYKYYPQYDLFEEQG